VWTKDKRVFFYNPSEKVSLWERPPILIGRLDVDKMIREPQTSTAAEPQAKQSAAPAKKKPTEGAGAEPPTKKQKPTDDEDETSRDSLSSGSNSPRNDRSDASPAANSPSAKQVADEFLQKDKIEASKEAAIEAEHKAAQVRAQLPLKERIQQFTDMLVEKEVSAYSTWEKELQKIVFDPRYLLLTSKERKQVFDKHVKDRANQESKEKAAALKRKRDDYRDLLRQANVSLKSTIAFSEFSAHHARDERFKAIEKMKDRESMFNDYLSDLRKQEKEDKYAEKEKHKRNFTAMLKEIKGLHRNSSWTDTKKSLEDDPRYKAVENKDKRKDYFRDYCKYLDEKASNGDSASKSKDKSEHKHRDRDEKRDEDKPKDRMEHDHGSGDEERSGEDEEKRKEKEKQERIEASLRERNKEVRKIKEEYNSEREKERDSLRRDEAIESFKALLIDIIKPNMVYSSEKDKDKEKEKEKDKEKDKESKSSGELTWKEAKKILKRDSRWSYAKILEKEKKEQLFDEHMGKFRAKKRDLFYQLLDDAPNINLKSSTWRDVRKEISSDPRYEKLQQNEAFKLDKEFESYVSNRFQKAKADFKELLLQTKLITYETHAQLKEKPQYFKEIEDWLAKDKSFMVLECAPDERKQIVLDYIEKLHGEGPPPPPTATEPSRRK
jgi:transcription elongation regulator 1